MNVWLDNSLMFILQKRPVFPWVQVVNSVVPVIEEKPIQKRAGEIPTVVVFVFGIASIMLKHIHCHNAIFPKKMRKEEDFKPTGEIQEAKQKLE